jgi:hypothetical protein
MNKVFFLLALFPMIACGGKGMMSSNEPGWMDDPPELCAVGNSKIRSTPGNATRFAIRAGRDELARQLEVKVGNMVKGYLNEGGTMEGDFSEEKLLDVSKQVAKQSLNGSKREGKYISEYKDISEVHILVCLKPVALSDALDKMKQLGQKARRDLKKRADDAHADLNKELNNYK